MKMNRERLGSMFDHAVQLVGLTVLFGLFVAPYIVELVAKSATRNDKLLYTGIAAIGLTLLLYGGILIGMAIHAARKRNRVRFILIPGEARYGDGVDIHFAKAIARAIERLATASKNREILGFTADEQQYLSFQLYDDSHRTTQMRFVGEPKLITKIKEAIRARLAQPDMEMVRPIEGLSAV